MLKECLVQSACRLCRLIHFLVCRQASVLNLMQEATKIRYLQRQSLNNLGELGKSKMHQHYELIKETERHLAKESCNRSKITRD